MYWCSPLREDCRVVYKPADGKELPLQDWMVALCPCITDFLSSSLSLSSVGVRAVVSYLLLATSLLRAHAHPVFLYNPLYLLFQHSTCHQADNHDPPAGRTLPLQIWSHGILWDLRARGQWRVSILCHLSPSIQHSSSFSLNRWWGWFDWAFHEIRYLRNKYDGPFLKPVLMCVFPATSPQWWTTEEECLAMAHSYCTRYVNHTVSKYNSLNILNGIKYNHISLSIFLFCLFFI